MLLWKPARALLAPLRLKLCSFHAPTANYSKLPKASAVTPLTRALRRSNNEPDQVTENVFPCATLSTCESFNLPKVIELLHTKGYKDAQFLIPEEAVHVTFPSLPRRCDVMVLLNGTVVGWGFDESFLRKNFVEIIKSAQIGEYSEIESEDMDWKQGEEGSSSVENDVMVIGEGPQRLLDMAAFSFGLARSTKLAVLESKFESYIAETRKTSLSFYTNSPKKAQHREILRSIGQLLLLRGELNLYSELIETPDLYWSQPNLETLYMRISKNLDVAARINILNKKLDYATEEARIILATLNEEKASKLELIIIYLILVEVCIEIFHFYERSIKKDESQASVHSEA